MQYSPKKTNNGTYQVAASVSLSQTRVFLRVQPFKHQGKERIEFAGNYLHDHGARMAHNAIGRWSVMDPLMEKYYPVSFVDPDGMECGDSNDVNGKFGDISYCPVMPGLIQATEFS